MDEVSARIQRVRLSSTTLASALYDGERRQLELEFRSGTRYRYFRVPRDVYTALLEAPSKGEFFNRSIRNQFAFHNLSAAAAPIVLAGTKTK